MDPSGQNTLNATEKLEEVQNELRCSICHDYFVQASTLSCSHSFCFNCINAWRQTHTDCPVCRREILGMAPSRALDNMVAALNNSANSEGAVQAGLQQFGVWRNPANAQQNRSQNQPPNIQQEAEELLDFDDIYVSDVDSHDWDDEDDEQSYSDGSYDAEEEDDEEGEEEGEEEEGDEEEVDEDQEEEEEDEDNGIFESDSEYDAEDMDSDNSDDDEDDEDHANRSNRNNPNNDEYWILRGWPGRPDHWKELTYG